MHLTVARSFAEPTDRLAACWAGCELALATDTHAVRNELRELAIRSAFDLVLAPHSSPEVVGLRMDRGLMFLYGVTAAWDPLPIGRELTSITEIAERRSRLPFPMTGLMPAIHWVHRLRYIAADSEDERVPSSRGDVRRPARVGVQLAVPGLRRPAAHGDIGTLAGDRGCGSLLGSNQQEASSRSA